MATKKLQIVGSIVPQSDYSQIDSTQPDYIKNKLGDIIREITKENFVETEYFESYSDNSPPFYMWVKMIDTPLEINSNLSLYCQQENGEEIYLGDDVLVSDDDLSNVVTSSALGARFNVYSSWGEIYGVEPSMTPVDSNIPYFVLIQNETALIFASTQNYSNIKFRVVKNVETVDYIKLPHEALTFDSTPTEGSDNLVKSGDLYNVIGDINTVITQINSLIGGAS